MFVVLIAANSKHLKQLLVTLVVQIKSMNFTQQNWSTDVNHKASHCKTLGHNRFNAA